MDIKSVISELRFELQQLDVAIHSLEQVGSQARYGRSAALKRLSARREPEVRERIRTKTALMRAMSEAPPQL